jgi:hypothetical protein
MTRCATCAAAMRTERTLRESQSAPFGLASMHQRVRNKPGEEKIGEARTTFNGSRLLLYYSRALDPIFGLVGYLSPVLSLNPS